MRQATPKGWPICSICLRRQCCAKRPGAQRRTRSRRIDRDRSMSELPRPYFEDGAVTLYHGDALQLLPLLPRADAIICDPPYAQTNLDWDRWPSDWPAAAALVSDQMWCFGSLRMFLDRADELAGWKMAQDIVWEKHNGSNASNDRFRRVHELAVHFYRGDWASPYHEPQYTQ